MTVLVLLDNSSSAERAIPHAVNVARADGARLVLAAQHVQQAASLSLRRAARALAGRGLVVETVMLSSAGASPVIALVRDWRADLIVMVAPESDAAGHAGATALAGEILCRTGVPVLLVPGPDAPAHADALGYDDRLVELCWRRPASARQSAPGSLQ